MVARLSSALHARRRRASVDMLKTGARRLGFDVLPQHYYSPIPDLDSLPETLWTEPSELRGIDFDLPRQLAFVQEALAGYIQEFDAPRERGEDPAAFFLENRMYGSVDAELLYGVVRHFKPRRVLELGSGYSSLLIGQALERNREDGVEATHRLYDPYARAELAPRLREIADVVDAGVTDVPLEDFRGLGDGDVLFVDTTHTVKVGGDVNRVVLDVLPLLAPGVVVHFHDIFLPWEYPRDWIVRRGRFWAEQYLLQAFLVHNEAWRVLAGAHALIRAFPDEIGRLVPSYRPGVEGGALWLRRQAGQTSGSGGAGETLTS